MTARRAAPGESTIYRDDAGRWHGYVSMGLKSQGRRDRRHVSAAQRGGVVAKVRDLERQRGAGTSGVAGKAPTVEQWLRHWLDAIAARKVRPKTLEGYRSLIDSRLVPAVGHHRLDRLQPEHVEAFYRTLEQDGLSPSTVLKLHRVLSRALKVAVQRGKIARNVCALVDAPSADRQEVVPLTADEARRVLAATSADRNAARWSVALALGLRQGEALGLRWSDVDLDAGTLTVRNALQRQKGAGLVLVPPKSRAGRRTITLPSQLVEAMRAHRTAQVEERLAAANVWADLGFVFAQPNGRPLDPGGDRRRWMELLQRAGVRAARLHDARHTAATMLLQQGVPARVAMQILGHSQISLTLGTYSHVVPELAQDAADRMGAALWPLATTLAPSAESGMSS